jgi:hypothetical protein
MILQPAVSTADDAQRRAEPEAPMPMHQFARISGIIIAILALFLGPWQGRGWAATTLLPNGKQCFSGANGAYANGSMNMFQPGTTTPKATWQDANQVTLNSQPIQLDSNGCAIIYGTGSYRQQLFDGPVISSATSGTLIWDLTTTDTSATNNIFWAAVAAGTPNAITVVDAGFNATDGSIINFTANATNTAATTINPSAFGAITVLKDTTAGPVSLTGGEIVQQNPISVVYRASDNAFHLLNNVIPSVSGAAAPLCGAVGLKITNSSGTPNTIINLTADQIVMQSAAGAIINRGNVSLLAINTATGTVTSTANGMDGEGVGTSQWLHIYAIDNGAAPAGLVSTSATTPVLPSGYTFRCRLGAMRVDGSGFLLRTLQLGNRAQYVVTIGSNVAGMPQIAAGAAGSVTLPTWVAVSTANFIPPTATRIIGSASSQSGIVDESLILAPNNNYGSITNTVDPPPVILRTSSYSDARQFEFLLESTNIYWANNGGNFQLSAMGWVDKVNAN